MRISDWSSDVCSSDLRGRGIEAEPARKRVDPIECERSPPDDRPDIADQIARPPGGLPARGTGFQETEIGHVAQREERRPTPDETGRGAGRGRVWNCGANSVVAG